MDIATEYSRFRKEVARSRHVYTLVDRVNASHSVGIRFFSYGKLVMPVWSSRERTEQFQKRSPRHRRYRIQEVTFDELKVLCSHQDFLGINYRGGKGVGGCEIPTRDLLEAVTSGSKELRDPFEFVLKRSLQIVKSFERGILTRYEAGSLLFELFTPDNAIDAFKILPEKFQDDIKQRVRQMPVSPWDWLRTIPMDCYTARKPGCNIETAFPYRSDDRRLKPICDKLRSHFKEQSVVLEPEDPSPPIAMSLEEILTLEHDLTRWYREKDKLLSEVVAQYIFAWRKSGDQWECPIGRPREMAWCPSTPPTFASLDDLSLPVLWGALKCYHPWVYRNKKGRNVRWADVCLSGYTYEPGMTQTFQDCLIVIRESSNPKIHHCTQLDENHYHWFDAAMCAELIRAGKNFRIPGCHPAEVLCRALLVAKKCRQDDPPPSVDDQLHLL